MFCTKRMVITFGVDSGFQPYFAHSLKYFSQYMWSELDASKSLDDLIRTLSQSLEAARVAAADQDDSLVLGQMDETEMLAERQLDEDTFLMTMQGVAKVLLYMTVRDARMEHEERRYGDNVGRGQHPVLKPRCAKNKVSGQAAEVGFTELHKIRVGPIRFDDESDGESDSSHGTGGGSKRPHPRVGHFRMQACGPRRADRVRIWIRPQWIGLKNLAAAAPRLYDVG